MAILKDLIVHGSSRFLNKIYASEIQTPLIEAEAGIFKKLKADDATVVGLLDVQGELHTNSWTNSNIATIDGSFYITPTIGSDSGTVAITATSLNFSGTNYAVTSLYLGDNSSITWPQYSKVLVTGQILSNGEWIPLGTLLGQLSATAAAASIKINNIKDNKNQTSSVLTTLVNNGTTSSDYRNLKVSLYQRASSSTAFYPLGIYITAAGDNGRTFLDIYGGVNSLNTTSSNYGGFAEPNVRIGNLQGLPNVGGQSPNGWGIYTDNGYFKGIIAADRGYIGTGSKYWVIGNYEDDSNSNNDRSYIYNGTNSITSATEGVYLGTDGIRNYKDSTHNVTIKDGVITALGVNLTGTINATEGNIGGAKISNGEISVPAAYVSGKLTAATIDASKINSGDISSERITTNVLTALQAKLTSLNTNNLSAITANLGTITAGVIKHDTVGGTNGIWLSADTDTSSNITVGESTARKDWRLLVNNKFGVTKTGGLYASSANISGTITATDGTIGGIKIENGALKVSSINIGDLGGVSNYAQKTDVTQAIDNIEVGGRNLLKYDVKNYGIAVFKISSRSNCRGMYFACEGNQTYTISRKQVEGNRFWIVATTEEPVDGLACDVIFNEDDSILKHTFITPSTAKYVFIYLSNESDVINNGNIKAEKGNKATDWTPAPEDIEVDVDDARKTATSYITQINNTGIKITPYDKSGNDYLQINSDAISMYRNNVETLKIEDDSIRVGNVNYQNLLLEPNQVLIKKGDKESLKIKADEFSYFFKSGISPFHIKQLGHIETQTGNGTKKQFTSNSSYFVAQLLGVTINNVEQEENDNYTYSIQNGVCTVTFTSAPANNSTINFNYDIEYEIGQLLKTASDTESSVRTYIDLPQTCMEVLHVYVNNTETSAWHYPSFSVQGETITIYDYIRLDSDPGQGANIKVIYKTQPEGGFYMTLGTRATGSNDPGPYSIVIGEKNFATGQGAFAAGRNVNVSGEYSFAYGDGGNSDMDSVDVDADYACAIGKGLRVSRVGGFACGRYNTWSNSYTWAFQVGNGTGPMDRSDAFGVAENGNIYITGKLLSGVVGKNPHYLFTTEDFEVDNISVPATGGSVAAISETKIVNIAIDGYIAIGLMSFVSQTATNEGLNASCVFPYAWWLNQNYFRFSLRNTVASPAKCKIRFRILYIAADAINTSLFPSSGNV